MLPRETTAGRLVGERYKAWTIQCWKLIWKIQPRNTSQYKHVKQSSIHAWPNLKSFLIRTIVENVYTVTGVPNYFFSQTLSPGLRMPVWCCVFHILCSSIIKTKLYHHPPESLPSKSLWRKCYYNGTSGCRSNQALDILYMEKVT